MRVEHANKIPLIVSAEVLDAISSGRPVVALESNVITHGLRYPDNAEVASRIEAAVREGGATPATICIDNGYIKVGMTESDIERFATMKNIPKVSSRDISVILAKGGNGATTVSASLVAAELANIQFLASSGIGGVHRGAEKTMDISSDLIHPPVGSPTKVIGVGMNFHSFVTGLGEALPDYPILFHKTSSALTGCGSNIIVPHNTNEPVPEGELAVIIGKQGRFIDPSDSLDYVAGFTCANDISARDLEFRTSQWTSGKMLDTFCPLGPMLVTSDEIPELGKLRINTLLNGNMIQDGQISDLIFDIPKLISEISSVVTLEIGDVILTGTPSDLGALRHLIFLRHGDIITVEIKDVGVLENQVKYLQRK